MLVDAIAERCAAHGGTPVLWDPRTMANLMARDFWHGVQKLAEDLRRLGVGVGTRVAVSLPVGADLVTTIAAIWSVRASFVPLDSHEADARRHRILLSSGAALLLAKEPVTVEGTGCALAVIDRGRAAATRSANPGIAVHDGSEAYVMFTSGSTGIPKGIAVSHRSISSYVDAALARYHVPETGMTVLSQLPPTFDASLTTLLIPLVTRNVLRPVTQSASGSASLAEGLRDVAGPVFVKTTPGQLRLVAGMLNDAELRRLRGSLILGGEPLDFADLDRFRHLADLEIYNEYGPTEATVGCSSYHVAAQDPDQGPVPIGVPFPDTSFILVPAHRDGEDVGELTVTGPGVAAGYIDDPANSKFGGNWPSRSYRTGDRVRRDPAGTYHFLGRTDDQVKVNGFRVELGEVDTALRTACGGPAATVHTGSTLIGFLQRHPELNIPVAEERIAQLLPAHMRPAALHVVTELPLTSHGKIDRKRLVEVHSDSKVPRDELTEHFAALWRRLLRTESVADDTDFLPQARARSPHWSCSDTPQIWRAAVCRSASSSTTPPSEAFSPLWAHRLRHNSALQSTAATRTTTRPQQTGSLPLHSCPSSPPTAGRRARRSTPLSAPSASPSTTGMCSPRRLPGPWRSSISCTGASDSTTTTSSLPLQHRGSPSRKSTCATTTALAHCGSFPRNSAVTATKPSTYSAAILPLVCCSGGPPGRALQNTAFAQLLRTTRLLTKLP